jgi:hypothetical protein
MYTGPVASAARGRGNPYMPAVQPKGDTTVAMSDAGQVTIRTAADLKAVPDLTGIMNTTVAAQQIAARGTGAALELVAMGIAA